MYINNGPGWSPSQPCDWVVGNQPNKIVFENAGPANITVDQIGINKQ